MKLSSSLGGDPPIDGGLIKEFVVNLLYEKENNGMVGK